MASITMASAFPIVDSRMEWLGRSYHRKIVHQLDVLCDSYRGVGDETFHSHDTTLRGALLLTGNTSPSAGLLPYRVVA